MDDRVGHGKGHGAAGAIRARRLVWQPLVKLGHVVGHAHATAFEHDKAEISNCVHLYALVSRMRVVSTPKVVDSADNVARAIIQTYLAPNRTFRQVEEIVNNDEMNPLRDFSIACREELLGLGSS
jgi:hypothetical protein